MRKVSIPLIIALTVTTAFSYTLDSGWNLLGNCEKGTLSATSIYSSGDKMYRYVNNAWQEYSNSKKEFSSLDKNEGFWFYTTGSKNIDIKEESSSAGSFQISGAQWHLISSRGYILTSEMNTSNIEKIYTYSSAGWKTFIPNSSGNTLDMIKKGEGFWVKLKTDSTITVRFSDPTILMDQVFN